MAATAARHTINTAFGPPGAGLDPETLEKQQAQLTAEFPDFTITYKVLVDGLTWVYPVGVRWTAESGGLVLRADTAKDLTQACLEIRS